MSSGLRASKRLYVWVLRWFCRRGIHLVRREVWGYTDEKGVWCGNVCFVCGDTKEVTID